MTYGVIGGTGLGLGYIVSDYRSGEVVSRSPWAHHRHRGGRVSARVVILSARRRMADATCGIAAHIRVSWDCVWVIAVASGSSCKTRQKGGAPEGWTPSAKHISQRSERDFTLGQALSTWQWWAICLLMSVNTMAGVVDCFPGGAHFSGDGKSNRGDGCRSGWRDQHLATASDVFFGHGFPI